MSRTEIEGVQETIKTLGQIDPQLRKEFDANVKRIAAPIVDAAKAKYQDSMIPSGTRRAWGQGGRTLFPFTVAKARSGVKPTISTSKRKASTITVSQMNPAAAIYEFAGAASANPLGAAFSAKGRGPARVMWPTADANLGGVESEMVKLVESVERYIEKGLQ